MHQQNRIKGAEVSKLSKARLYRLLDLAQRLLVLEPESTEGSELLRPVHGVFGITAICLLDASDSRLTTIGSPKGELESQTRAAYSAGEDREDPHTGVTIHLLEVGGFRGAIAFQGLEDPHITAEPLMALVAALLEGMRRRQRARENGVAAEIEAFRSAILDVLGDDFKNALTTILMATGGLREAGPLHAGQLEMARIVEEEASRLGSVISRLDRIARLDQEEVRPRMDATDLGALVTEAIEQCSKSSPERQIVLTSSGIFKALADAELIRLALSQLLDHARKHSVPGSSIQVGVEARGSTVVVSVATQGSIPSRERHRMFERSYLTERAEPLSGTGSPNLGTGSSTGLYVARKIAIAHGGTLDFDAEQIGTESATYHLCLPRANSEPDSE